MPEIRIIDDPANLLTAAAVFRQAMFGLPGGVTPVSEWAERYVVPGRVYGAWLDGQLVGTSNSFPGKLTLPGGQRVPHAAVTHVGVLPHVSRRGVLRALFARQLTDLHQQGVAVASLRASQGTLYRRFGYGVATAAQDLRIDKRELPALPAADGGIQLLVAADSWEVLQDIVARFPLVRAGSLSRWPQWWALQQHRLAHSNLNHYVAVVLRHGEPQGFVRYHARAEENWLYSTERTLVVDDLHAADPQLEAQLLGFLLQLDIARYVELPHRPVDDALPLLLDNPRAVQQHAQVDESWLRVIDLEQTLNARRYGNGDAVTLAIDDPWLPANHGVWRLTPDGVQRSASPPDISLSIDSLAMLLLGEYTPWQLAAARRINLHHSQAASRLARLLACHEHPWSGIFF